MTDLRKAAEMALNAWEKPYGERAQAVEDAIEELRQALAQPEQEPVDVVKVEHARQVELAQAYERGWNAALAHGQEPVAWVECAVIPWLQSKDTNVYAMTKLHRIPNEHYDTPLYTAPPKRQWIGLTDEEIKEYEWMGKDVVSVIKEVQATLKEKNT